MRSFLAFFVGIFSKRNVSNVSAFSIRASIYLFICLSALKLHKLKKFITDFCCRCHFIPYLISLLGRVDKNEIDLDCLKRAHMSIICIEMDKNKENERKNMFLLGYCIAMFLCEIRCRIFHIHKSILNSQKKTYSN